MSMTIPTHLYYELTWLTKELSKLDYSEDARLALVYEVGLLRSLLAEAAHNDTAVADMIRAKIRQNPYYKE